jgi:AcrR family transcriptional regulator
MAKRIPAAERRRQIAAAAGVLFADRGVQATTVRDIADRVGMLSGSLYHHFKTKHDIVHELMRDYGEELLSRYRAAATATEDGNSAEQLEALFRACVQSNLAHPHETAILIHEQSKLFALDEFDYVNRVVEEVEAIFVRVIVEGMNRGEVRTDIAPAFTYRMMMDVMGAVQRWYDPGKHSEDLVVQAWLDVFLRGIAPR